MKASKLLTVLPMFALLLTGCDKSMKQEDFVAKLNEAKAYLTEHADEIKNIRIKDTNKLGSEMYNYKEGEFYSHTYVDGVILFIPTTAKVATWKEDGKYYHGENYNFFKTDVPTKEITEEEFNTYMAAGKATIMEQLMYPIARAEGLIDGSTYEEGHKPENKFILTYKGEAQLKSKEYYKLSSEDTEWKERTITVGLKNNLPVRYITKDTSEKGWNYTLNKAAVDIPTWESSESGSDA